jgi:type IV secretory pathway TraG/TraD family ATPase VirD4
MSQHSLTIRQESGFVAELNAPLLQLGPKDALTLANACQGVAIFGGTGSGKTSGSARALAHAFLRQGFGGIVLCAKPDEAALWRRYAEETGRTVSVLRIGTGTPWRINFLEYVLAKYGMEAINIAVGVLKLMADASRLAKSRPSGEGAQFWEDANHQALINALPILYSAYGRVRLDELYRFIQMAPQSEEEAISSKWQEESFLYQTIAKARSQPVHPLEEHALMACGAYWRFDFARLDPKTRSNIVITMTSLLSRFAHGRLHDLFCTHTTFVPELCLEGGILILDMPVKTWQEDGIIAQHIIKFLWQRAVEARAAFHAGGPMRPVFLWADECQFFVNEYDAEFQSTARSARASTVYITQNLPTLFAKIGGQNPQHYSEMLLGNLMTKIFHANGCATTNRWAAETIGQGIVLRHGMNRGTGTGGGSATSTGYSTGNSWSFNNSMGSSIGPDGRSSYNRQFATGSGGNEGWNKTRSRNSSWNENEGESLQEQKDYKIDPSVFANQLRTGGKENGRHVDAVIVRAGSNFTLTGDHFLPITFMQEG